MMLSNFLSTQCLDEYKNLDDNIIGSVTELQITIVILRKIHDFPFDFIYSPHENIFWRTVFWNFSYTAINLIFGLLYNNDNNAISLSKFTQKVLELIKEEQKDTYREIMKDDKVKTKVFESKNKEIVKRLEENRNKVAAHRDVNGPLFGVTVDELDLFCEEITRRYVVYSLSDDVDFRFGYLKKDTNGTPIPEDLENVLDKLIQNSAWFKRPENDQYWDIFRNNMANEEIDMMNSYRRKFGYPEI